MSVKHKYVRHSLLGFVLWPHSDDFMHVHVAREIERRVSTQIGGEILSAGFAHIGPLTLVCSGESESLGIKSRPDDSLALARQLGRVTTADQVVPRQGADAPSNNIVFLSGQSEYLKEQTGDRRFWAVEIEASDIERLSKADTTEIKAFITSSRRSEPVWRKS